ncbi:hypothetical protein FQR65_LT08372 [Abscondita terminalis]|nr:hypothetical protein FQR65_LT08372 [Abscondita terminalis]
MMDVFLNTCLVLLVRSGFVLVQLSSIPSLNVFVIIYQNVLDVALSIATFGSLGCVIAFGDDLIGIVGYKKWLPFNNATDTHNVIIGLLTTLIATGIVTTILCGRISMCAYFFLVFLLSGFIQPAVIHWVWYTEGWLYSKEFLFTTVSFRDDSGGLTIHVFGGTVCLIGALFFGRRLLLLSDISELSIGVESPGISFVGYIFIIIGLIGFSLTSFDYGHQLTPNTGILIINNLSAMSGGILVIAFLQHFLFRRRISYWNILRCIQGGVAGIVTISPGINLYKPEFAFLASLISSATFYLFSTIILLKTSIEDYCNVISIHLVCGIFGLFLCPFFKDSDPIKQRLIQSLWQLLVTFTVIFFLIIVISILFFALLLCRGLRNKLERIDHERGVLAVKNRGKDKTFLDRIFNVTSSTPFLEPGSSSRNPSQIESLREPTKSDDIIVRNVRFAYTIANVSKFDDIIDKNIGRNSGDHLNGSSSHYDLHRNMFSNHTSLKDDLSKCIHLQEV